MCATNFAQARKKVRVHSSSESVPARQSPGVLVTALGLANTVLSFVCISKYPQHLALSSVPLIALLSEVKTHL